MTSSHTTALSCIRVIIEIIGNRQVRCALKAGRIQIAEMINRQLSRIVAQGTEIPSTLDMQPVPARVVAVELSRTLFMAIFATGIYIQSFR